MEIKYLDDLFHVVYQKFLNAIDHIEYHPTLQKELTSEMRSKHSIFFSKTGFYNTFDHRLSPTEELFLDKLFMTSKFRRMKRYSILTWVLGWGVFSNA